MKKNKVIIIFTLGIVLVAILNVVACTSSISSSTALTTTTFATIPVTTSTATPTGLDKIKHFVFIMQENRSFDSYFGTYPGANGIPSGVSFVDPYDGSIVTPYHDTNDINLGGPHGWINAQADINSGNMDGFLNQTYKGTNADGTPFVPGTKPGTNPKDVMGYHDLCIV